MATLNRLQEREEKLREQLKQVQAEKRRKESQARAKATKQARADDTRRKILLGSMYLSKMESNPEFKANIMSGLNSYLKADRDRQLFGLQPKQETGVTHE